MKSTITLALVTILLSLVSAIAAPTPVGAAAALINMKEKAEKARNAEDYAARQTKHIAKFKAAVALFKIYDRSTEENTKERERNFVRAYAAFSLMRSEWKVIDKSRRLEVLLDKGVQENLQNKDPGFPPIDTLALMDTFLKETYPDIDGFSALSVVDEIPALHDEVKEQVRRLALETLKGK